MLNRLGLFLVLWLTLAGAAHAAVIDVTRSDDRAGGKCAPSDCTLREAIAFAAPGDTVKLAGGQIYGLSQGAQLLVDKPLTITGAGPGVTAIDGGRNLDTFMRVNRIMRTESTVTIRDLSFRNGRDGNDEVPCSACPTLSLNGGGAIFNTGALTLERVRFEGNEHSPVGGAVSNAATLALTDVEFRANRAAYGGALFSRTGSVTASGVTVHENAGSARGAVYLAGGTMLLENATVTGNGQSNTIAGGIANAGGDLVLRNATVADNVRGGLLREGGVTKAQNTLLASGCVPAGQFGALAAVSSDLGHNLDEDDSCGLTAATRVVGPARLAPVGDNGGGTPTMALLSGSAALDQVPVQDCTAVDQRGFVRQSGLCDIGAFEAVRGGEPSAATGGAEDAGAEQAYLLATVDLAGEAGKLSFEWGRQPGALEARTPGVGIGTKGSVTRGELVSGLPPDTEIFYRAVAENASGTARGAVRSFTTPPGPASPPSIRDLRVVDVGDDHVTLRFTIDPGGPEGAYRIRVDGDDPPLTRLAGAGPHEITRTLTTGLRPEAEHRLQVVAYGPGGETADDDGIVDVRTLRRVTGRAGVVLELGHKCEANARIDWGDGGASSRACVNGGLTATHTYATGGRYRVRFTYEDGTRGALVAAVSPTPGLQVLSVNVTGRGRVVGGGIDCPGVCSVELPPDALPTLTTLPAAGEQFQGWAGACHGTGPCALELTEDRTVAADFSGLAGAPTVERLRVVSTTDTTARVLFSVNPNGSPTTYRLVWPGGESAAAAVGTGFDPLEFAHTLTGLTPETAYDVQVLAVNPDGEASDRTTFTTARRALRHTVTVSVSGDGRVTGDGLDCPGTCSATVEEGTVLALTATPASGQRFAGWDGACAGAGACSVTLDADRAVSATFTAEPVVVAQPTPTPSPVPTPTPTPSPGPEPTVAVDVVGAPAGGTIRVRRPGTKRFVTLTAGQELPYGTEIDARKGRVTLTSIPKAGAPPEQAVFYAGRFKVTFVRGITNLTLTEPLARCPKARGGRASAAAKKAKSRKLWGKGKGAFRTTGKYSAATVRGTTWLVQDSCAGTLTRVTQGAVTVRAGKKTVVVRAGKRYLAKRR